MSVLSALTFLDPTPPPMTHHLSTLACCCQVPLSPLHFHPFPSKCPLDLTLPGIPAPKDRFYLLYQPQSSSSIDLLFFLDNKNIIIVVLKKALCYCVHLPILSSLQIPLEQHWPALSAHAFPWPVPIQFLFKILSLPLPFRDTIPVHLLIFIHVSS